MASPLFIADLEFSRAVIQAPMAGGITTPELVAAVSEEGGLGSLGAGYLTPEAIIDATHAIRALTPAPFAINLFAPTHDAPGCDIDQALNALKACYADAGVEMPTTFSTMPDFDAQFEAMLSVQPALFSFTFGTLDRKYIDACRARHIALVGTATSIFEANGLALSGVDAIVLQGEEAGGHCGSHDSAGAGQPLLPLISECRAHIDLPLIAAGGLMSALDIHCALQAGADAAQCGTAFLLADEAGTSDTWRRALQDTHESDATEITYAVSGRAARGLKNAWMGPQAPRDLAPYPVQHQLTSPLRHLSTGPKWKSLWAGKQVHHIRSGSVSEVMAMLDH
ncbi:NAD(P)H-dependent flavin oxidoreductase [Larsenimonas salina]|uniref:NAD(P)H-dependent flavin oxidoreductase n=1 Tax=Larsenimonas salina TaxID=1295565 RepID=UPI0020734F16|nr:nitronate monooxygenase [Larsenimonas salina]MCM5705391.1 nitronate monooxygenase [Larsenimonas salina]